MRGLLKLSIEIYTSLFGRKLIYIKSIHNYHRGTDGTDVINWEPRYDYTINDTCKTREASVSRGGVTATSSTRVCPDQVKPYRERTYFRHGWFGSHSTDTLTGSPGQSVVKVPNRGTSGFVYNIVALEDGAYEGATIEWGRD